MRPAQGAVKEQPARTSRLRTSNVRSAALLPEKSVRTSTGGRRTGDPLFSAAEEKPGLDSPCRQVRPGEHQQSPYAHVLASTVYEQGADKDCSR